MNQFLLDFNPADYELSKFILVLKNLTMDCQDEETRNQNYSNLATLKSLALPICFKELTDTCNEVRIGAGFILGIIGDKRATNYLIKALLEDPSPLVRMQCAHSLGRLIETLYLTDYSNQLDSYYSLCNIPDLIKTLLNRQHEDEELNPVSALIVSLSSDENIEVCFSAAWALSRINYEECFKLFSRMLQHEDEFLLSKQKGVIVRVIGEIYGKEERSVFLFLTLLRDEDKDIRLFAAEALSRSSSKWILKPLFSSLSREICDGVRLELIKSIKEVAISCCLQYPEDFKLLTPMREYLFDNNFEIQSTVIDLVGKLGIFDPEIISSLINISNDIDKNSQKGKLIFRNIEKALTKHLRITYYLTSLSNDLHAEFYNIGSKLSHSYK